MGKALRCAAFSHTSTFHHLTTHAMSSPNALRALLTTFASLMLSCAASAMTWQPVGDTLYATGPVVDTDFLAFKEAVATQPGLRTVALVNSPGGDLWTGLQIGRLITAQGLNTVSAGACMSACSILFMGGVERRYADTFKPGLTTIGFHGAHNRDTKKVDPQLQPQIFAFYKQRMGDRFHADIINQALYEMDDAGAFLRVPDPARVPSARPSHCRSINTPRAQCTSHATTDAVMLGIATHRELVALPQLPASMAPLTSVLFDRALDTPLKPVDEWLHQLSGGDCRPLWARSPAAPGSRPVAAAQGSGPPPNCDELAKRWNEAKGHKALALPAVAQADSFGYGWVSNRDTPAAAVLGAIYQCNHPRNRPARLCTPALLDVLDLQSFNTTASAQHATALASLRPPADTHYANEQFGGGFTQANGLRTTNLGDITPGSLQGIAVIHTQALAQQLTQPKPPVVIYTGGETAQVIPGSQALIHGGNAFADPKGDAVFQTRFKNLLQLLAPNPAAPVVFYCAGRNCWHSVNAALRALALGYTQVQWYRGGLEAWATAQLPLAPVLVQAVAN
jgi:rhodanese-related sulfurtransferase